MSERMCQRFGQSAFPGSTNFASAHLRERTAARRAALVKIGMEADLTLPQFPNRTFRAHVTNTADAVDPTSRSLLTQLQIPNESGELLPGATEGTLR
jgi:multidrug efflux pump subunit AcrA (membrane-fusion protein)